MRILSLDTTAEFCSIALADGDHHLMFHEERPREHAKILLPEVDKLLAQADLAIADLDLVVYGRGPGSFTGVRIAAGVAQGLAVAAGCPIVPVSTLQSLAFEAMQEALDDIWVAIDARMSEVYFARYIRNMDGLPELQGAEQVVPPASIEGVPSSTAALVGNGWFAGYPFSESLAPAVTKADGQILLPNALVSLDLAKRLLAVDPSVAVAPEKALPVYLRDNVTWDNKPKVGS